MHGWQNFYTIVGTAGSTLIGIQFLVITLIATVRTQHASMESLSAFGTPTVVHFAGAVVIAAVMSVPWASLASASVAITVCALVGVAYAVRVILRARRQTAYEPVAEDWLWYTILPCTVYAAMLVAAVFLPRAQWPPFMIGAAALGLLLIGVHNAWDSVTYIAIGDD